MARIYLDANATTPLLAEVFEAMRPCFFEAFGNPSSTHRQGQQARVAVDRARESVARLLHAKPSEIVFTSGGTESDNLALFGIASPAPGAPPAHLITTAVEHHAVLHAAEALEKAGTQVTILPCDPNGIVQPETLAAALKPNTRLVSILYANNETGVLQPIPTLARIAKQHGALFHTDAVQGAGKMPLDLAGELRDVDLLSLSGHKMYAPQGVGALFVRTGLRLAPLFHGGTHERERRAGTENVPGIVALGKAAELACAWLADPAAPAALAALRDRFEQAILNRIEGAALNAPGAPRTANTINLHIDGVEAESLLIALDLRGLAVSAGSACQSGASSPSHVLRAMGLSNRQARSSLRISLSRHTTAEELDRALDILIDAVACLRKFAPALAPSTPPAEPAQPALTHA